MQQLLEEVWQPFWASFADAGALEVAVQRHTLGAYTRVRRVGMDYTVWRRGVLLGRTDLAMPSAGPRFRAGQFAPTVEFERAWPELGPVVGEFFAAAASVGGAVNDLPPRAAGADPEERARQVYERLSAHPDAARLRAASDGLASLGLELRDSAGRPVAVENVMIQEVRPPVWVPEWAIARDVEQARREGLEIRVPSYVVVVQDVTDAPDAGSASRPPA